MQPFPYVASPYEPTIKQVWMAAFTALLTHMSPEGAAEAADQALVLSNKRWSTPRQVVTWEYSHNFPIGYRFDGVRIGPPPEGQASEST